MVIASASDSEFSWAAVVVVVGVSGVLGIFENTKVMLLENSGDTFELYFYCIIREYLCDINK